MSSTPSSIIKPVTSSDNQMKPQSVMWAHLLRKNTTGSTSTPTALPLPPLAPADKNATSTRILLHDTQANLQKFSERVEKMTQNVENTRREISTVKTLFQDEHEALVGEMVDLVNRCQSEIKRPLGTPAQAEKLEDFQKNVELRLEHLDKRLDAIQMFQTTHSQTLQTQNQLLQALRDQQTTIVATVSPLLPLMQALPVHIESIRATIHDMTSKAFDSSRVANSSSPKQTPTTPKTTTSSHNILATLPITLSMGKKRRRIDENLSDMPVPQAPNSNSTPAVTKSFVLTSSIGRRPSLVGTPRRPLFDLPVNHSKQAHPGPSNEKRFTPKTNSFVPPSSVSRQAQPLFLVPALRPTPAQSADKTSSLSATPQRPQIPSIIATVARPSTPQMNASTKSTARKSPPPHLPRPQAIATRPQIHHPTLRSATPTSNNLTRNPTTLRVPMSAGAGRPPFTAAPLRQRRSPFREGRRFIPLDDSDDDSDEQ